MSDRLLTSTEAAELLGASPTSVKRWADAGLLPCVKTAGKHRRFTRQAVEAFAQGGPVEQESEELDLLPELLRGDAMSVQGRLLTERALLGSWAAVCDRLGPVVRELGVAWAEGRVTVIDEHLASERLSRALASVASTLPASPQAPSALLTTAERDEHTLGLSMVEVTLREAGWRTLWSGRRTPVELLRAAIVERDAAMLVVSASSYSSDAEALRRFAEQLAQITDDAGCALVVGGSGRWPDPMPGGTLIRSFRGLSTFASAATGG